MIAHSVLKKHVHEVMRVLLAEGIVSDNKEALDSIAEYLGTDEAAQRIILYTQTRTSSDKSRKDGTLLKH